MQFHNLAAGLTLATAIMAAIGPARSMTSNQPYPDPMVLLSEHGAREVAWRFGIVHIEEIARSGDRWEIAGRDGDGNEAALDISVHDGRVLD